jgi:hypothetical protein
VLRVGARSLGLPVTLGSSRKRGENPAPGKDVHGEVDPTPGIRETLARSKPTTAALFDHLVGNGEESGRESEAERLGGFQVYDQLD